MMTNEPIGVTDGDVPLFEIPKTKDRKHEEIKQKAWEIYHKMQLLEDKFLFEFPNNKRKNISSEDILPLLKIAWRRAKGFYEFAKMKEKEKGND